MNISFDMYRNKRLLLALSIPTIALIALVTYRVSQYSSRPEGRGPESFRAREISMQLFRDRTKKEWGQMFIDASDTAAVQKFFAKQSLAFADDNRIVISDKQKTSLYTVIAEFVKTYNAGDLRDILAFHDNASYEIDVGRFNNSTFQKELKREGISLPDNSPEALLSAYWTLLQRFKFRTDFWNGYKAEQEKLGATPDGNSLEVFDKYLADLKANPAKYVSLKIMAISSNLCEITLYSADTNTLPQMDSKLLALNRSRYEGVQTEKRTIFLPKKTPAQLVAENGKCTFAIVEMAVRVNVTDAFTPITIVFHWNPDSQTWSPDSLVRHAYGQFSLLF
jgi:hypothetical protein